MTCSSLRGAIRALVRGKRGLLSLLIAPGGLGAAVVLCSSEAHAEDPASHLRLSYEAPRGCASQSEFRTALSSRVQSSWLEGEDSRSFDVRVARADSGFVGRLVIRQPGRSPNTREIHGSTCKGVTAALVVFVAIALDPASESPTGTAPDETSLPDESSETESAPASTDAPPPAALPPRARRPKRPPSPAPATPPRRPVVWTWAAGASAVWLRAPESSWGARLHVDVSRSHERDAVAPAVRLSWGWADFSTNPAQAGEARFRLKSARLEAGLRAGVGRLTFATFLGLELGALTGVAADLPRFEEVHAPWRAWTGSARVGLAMTPWLELDLAATLLMPFERPRFEVEEPARWAYRAPSVLFEGSAGIVAVARF
jgi:hypothetical protein